MKAQRQATQNVRSIRKAKMIKAFCSSVCFLLWLNSALVAAGQKAGSSFFPEETRARMRANAGKTAWGETVSRAMIEGARPWLSLSDEALWNLMFGPTITRSWMVWTNGYCPSCKKPVPMYSWKVDAMKTPWKMECPHCGERFPKNDFYAFYKSGLDEHGIFNPKLAKRQLLFNADHPKKSDPDHFFGVDDGNGYVEGEKRWRFIGAYLVYGQWKQAVLDGIVRLAHAYLMTGEVVYARKAIILLDRVADLYPTFDFKTQAIMYEGPAAAGYVSTWHDACEETRLLALAYDQVYDAIGKDSTLRAFLARKSRKFKLENRKQTAADIQRNIEERILEDAVANRWKIRSNYPRTDTAVIIIQTVLGWPGNHATVMGMIDEMVKTATAVDGVTGEKGLAAYAASTIANLAYVLALFDRLDTGFLEKILARHPALRNSYRFHFDTWFRALYYPEIGDSGNFGQRRTNYAGANFIKDLKLGSTIFNPQIDPSMFTFFMRLYDIIGDPAYVQILFHENGENANGLPFDLLGPDPSEFQRRVTEVIARGGSVIRSSSFDKQQWHLAMLRSGIGENERAVWLDYDTGGGHGHADGMNIGLFAKGLDLMPDLGYPPVQYAGGWESVEAKWYKRTACHNTVIIDGKDQRLTAHETYAGHTTLWGVGETLKAIRVSGPEVAEARQYERTVALLDISEKDSYVLDLFRVVGGRDHARFMHSLPGAISTTGLALRNLPDYGFDTQLRSFRGDPAARSGWSADWQIEDPYGYRPPGGELHLRLTDLTSGAEAASAEGWISLSPGFNTFDEAWIPTVMVRHRAVSEPLASAFVGVIEPYEGHPLIESIRRLPLCDVRGTSFPDSFVALEIILAAGRHDILVSVDSENPLRLSPSRDTDKTVIQKDLALQTDAEFCFARRDQDGRIVRVVLGHGTFLELGDLRVSVDRETDFIEVAIDKAQARVVGGAANGSLTVALKGKKIPILPIS
jgi:hypothetical protein